MVEERNTNVNGPINTIRVEGTIYGIKKVVYFFMDYHKPVHSQSQCDEFDNIDIQKYMINEFRNAKKESPDTIYDFFLEIYPGQAKRGNIYADRGRYIDEAQRFFSAETISNKKHLENVRYHYIDFREYILPHINDLYDGIFNKMQTWKNSGYISQEDYNAIHTSITLIKNSLKITKDFLMNRNISKDTKINRQNNNDQNEDIEKIIKTFYEKINTRYKHKDIPEKLNELRNIIFMLIDKLSNALEDFSKKLDDVKEYLLIPPAKLNIMKFNDYYITNYGFNSTEFNEFYNYYADIDFMLYSMMIYIYANIVDLFILRRLLDKDYITHCVVYTGAAHSQNCIETLVKYFGFNITHASYIHKDYTIESVNKTIRESKSPYNNKEIHLMLMPDILHQCSHLDHFPRNFT